MLGSPIWIEAFAAQRGLHYEAAPDERWLRAWEPFATLKVPIRYEHALSSTGSSGSITIARAVVQTSARPPHATELSTWIAIVQDPRIAATAATSSDFSGVFNEPLDLVTMPRWATGDAAFDHVFASFAPTQDDLRRGVTPSLRRLLLAWRIPVHAEVRPGGFVLAPIAVNADDRGLAWTLEAVHLFGAKATKPAT